MVRRTNSFATVLFALVSAAVLGTGCTSVDGEPVEEGDSAQTAAPAVWATPQWSERDAWYRTPQGSHLLEYDVFMALERADRDAPFASRENLEQFGFVYYSADTRLPLGVVKDRDESRGKDFVGLTCAACHTGEIVHKNKRIVVEGGQAFLEWEPFIAALQKAVDIANTDAAKKQRVCAAIRGQCEAKLKSAKDRIDGLRARNRQTVADGPGRLDAVSRILNEVFSPKGMGGQLGGEAPGAVQVPVSFPPVWDAPRLKCVQTNCLSTNAMTRNSGEVLGVFGHSTLTRDGDNIKVSGSPRTEDLYTLEKALESLKSPSWEAHFGTLDNAKVKRGETLFEANCARCHAEPYKNDPDAFVEEKVAGQTRRLWNVTTIPYKEVGTDPRFIEVHGARMVKDAMIHDLFDQALKLKLAEVYEHEKGSPPNAVILEGLFLAAKTKQTAVDRTRTLDGKISSLLALGAVTGGLERSAIAEQTTSPVAAKALKHRYEFYRAPAASVELANYRARPLNGVAFTAPYGHNGSWPTLWDVLQTPDKRTKKFVVRPRSFDTEKVGLDIRPARSGEKLFELDTSTVANSNRGHNYGTSLSDTQKDDLLEYLKSL